jgi:hypothetical protein
VLALPAYPKWRQWLQKSQPALRVIWGKHDLSFDPGEPENAQVHGRRRDISLSIRKPVRSQILMDKFMQGLKEIFF